MTSLTSKTTLKLAAILMCFAIVSPSCSKKPRVITVTRVVTGCLETVGERPIMRAPPQLQLDGCPPEMACLNMDGVRALSRWIGETLRWMEQVEIACQEKDTEL